jgi:hypothetical protein
VETNFLYYCVDDRVQRDLNAHAVGWRVCTLMKKKKKNFLICKEIQMGAVAKSSRRKDFLIYEEMGKYLVIQIWEAVSNI